MSERPRCSIKSQTREGGERMSICPLPNDESDSGLSKPNVDDDDDGVPCCSESMVAFQIPSMNMIRIDLRLRPVSSSIEVPRLEQKRGDRQLEYL